MSTKRDVTLYTRLGGYEAIAAVADNLLSRLRADDVLGRFWQHRGADGIAREKQLLVNFLCSSAGGPLHYTGRDMALCHKGMRISSEDWGRFLGHVNATLDRFNVPAAERGDVLAFVESTREDIVESSRTEQGRGAGGGLGEEARRASERATPCPFSATWQRTRSPTAGLL